MMNKIGFVGASHLGICSAVAAAHKKFDVIIYDSNLEILENIKKSKVDFFEPNIKKYLHRNQKKIEVTNNLLLLKKCSLIYISQDTPTNDKNISNFKIIKNLIDKVLKNINSKAVVVVLCQVYPGFTEEINWKKNQLFYQVETLIFGNAIERAINPEQIIIGQNLNNNKKSKELLNNFVKNFTKNIKYMDYKSAELSKIAINLYLSSSITYSNSMSELCEKIGADWRSIEGVLRKDKRIGHYAYLKPGLGILSGNLQRDLVTSQKIFKKTNCNSNLIENFINLSFKRKNWLFESLKKIINNKKKKLKIGIFGVTYKENVSTLKNSPFIDIVKNFNKQNFLFFDPINDLKIEINNAIKSKSFEELIKYSDVLIFLTPWPFIKKNINQKKIKNFEGKFIIDPYDIIHDRHINLKKVIKLVMGRKIND